jgi:type IV secretion system protein VirB1
MMLHTISLAALMTRCAPNVAPSTMTAIVQVESGGDPLAIGDNTARRSYHPRDRANAEVLARRLIEAGHSLDLGIAQIDNMNFAGFGVNVHMIFDPCTNLNIGSRILWGDYMYAARRYGNRQIALRHAIGMYNTGQLDAGEAYVRRVIAASGVQEKYDLRRAVATVREAMRSPLVVRVSPERRKRRSNGVTPLRAPILVKIASIPRVVIF